MSWEERKRSGERLNGATAIRFHLPAYPTPPPLPVDPSLPRPAPPPDPALLDRVRGVLPVVHSLIGKVQAVGMVSAGAAVVLWAVLFGTRAWPLSIQTGLVLFVLGVLLIPAAGTFLAVGVLREVIALPGRLRALPGAVRDSAVVAREQAAGGGRSRRLVGFFGVLWRLRGIVADTQSSWLQTLALARFARLASLPFALALVGAFALNFAVIAAAVVVVLVALAF